MSIINHHHYIKNDPRGGVVHCPPEFWLYQSVAAIQQGWLMEVTVGQSIICAFPKLGVHQIVVFPIEIVIVMDFRDCFGVPHLCIYLLDTLPLLFPPH